MHLGDGDLSVAKIAKHHRTTPSYFHNLFENEGLTFSWFVLGQHLSRVHCILSDPYSTARNISSVALDMGFGDLSHFNRTFRRRYSAMRADAPRRSSQSRSRRQGSASRSGAAATGAGACEPVRAHRWHQRAGTACAAGCLGNNSTGRGANVHVRKSLG
ncbi:MAG: helix-turn-helix domain-containing protein [Hyphomicrobiales bacterium]|nr:helix-turn-helix domain-containing protein [Hyphomicrobiales bacterium]